MFGKVHSGGHTCRLLYDSKEPFSRFKIAGTDSFEKNLNKFNMIKIALNVMLSEWSSLLESGKTKAVTEYIMEFVC